MTDQSSFSPDNPVAERIRSLSSRFQEVVFQHCNRNSNRVTHELARICFRNGFHLLFPFAIPICIGKYVLVDLQPL